MSNDLITKPPRESGAASAIDITPSFYERVKQGLTFITSGKAPEWFGPRAPLAPVAPPDVGGRQLDYPVGININVTPKAGEGWGFNTLRQLGDSWDLLRLVLETQKDRVCQLGWNIVPRNKKKLADERCQNIERWLQMPDKEHTWEEWLRMVVEDLLVVDAPCIFPRPAMDGTLFALEPVDGTTIKRVIDDYGRTPQPGYTAYQQILKGLPAANFERDELIYRPRNVRTHKLYGFGPVEQIVTTISLALNRVASQIEYYKSGSTPDLILAVPEGWTPEQIAKFKVWWDSILMGNTAAKRGTMFVFKGMDTVNTKDQLFVDKMDEWLARVVCFGFGMSPQPFIQQNNRAAAVAAATQAKEEGLAPIMAWITNLMNFILIKYFDAPELQFMFEKNLETDPLSRAQICNIKARAGALTINQWRQIDGDEGLGPEGDVPMIYVGTGAIPLKEAAAGNAMPSAQADATMESTTTGKEKSPTNGNRKSQAGPTTRLQNKKPASRTVNDGAGRMNKARGEIRPVTKNEVVLASEIATVLRGMEQSYLTELSKYETLHENDVDALIARTMVRSDAMRAPLVKALTDQVAHGVASATLALTKAAGPPLANVDAAAYAAARAASLITQIDETTRQMIRDTVAKAIRDGWGIEELAKALAENYAFSPARAATIASTEMNDALTHAQLEAWSATGLVKGIEWVTSPAEGVCVICLDNESDGVIPLGETFSSGDDGPPAHPNCRCGIVAVTEEEYP